MPVPTQPQQQPTSRHPTHLARRGALAVVFLGASGVLAWQWQKHRQAAAAQLALALVAEDDVCLVVPPALYNPTSGIPLHAAREVPADARCPVCGMYPARSRAWAGQVIFSNGDAYFFDSPLSLLMYLGNVGHYTRGRQPEDIVARYVTDTPTGAWLDAATAMYVTGSSAMGPMRAGNLPAFQSRAAAQQFTQQRGGRVLAFSAIDAALLQTLTPARKLNHSEEHPS